jgi:flagellar biosynthesis protein FliQ
LPIPQVLEIGQELLLIAILLAMPTVVASLLTGLIISILQAVTSIQEQTLSFAPRIVVVAATIIITMPWSLRILINFTHRMIWQITEVTS